MPRGVRMNAQASSSSIGELLRDPGTLNTPLFDVPTPSSRRSRPATAPSLENNNHISDVLNGESERTSGAHLRRLHGCDVHCHDGMSTRTGRKNVTSAAEIVVKKGRATVDTKSDQRTFTATNTLVGPESGPEGDRHPKKMFGRITHHNGDIITAPPSVEWEDKRRAKNATAGRAHLSRQQHGDIISGRDQGLLHGTGKSKSALGVSRANQGTFGLLHWNEDTGQTRTPARTVSGGRQNAASGKNQSAQMTDAMAGAARTPKQDPPPRGQSLIDRLALGTAYAVIAPRDNAHGRGIADLKIEELRSRSRKLEHLGEIGSFRVLFSEDSDL